jgi:hypothetical protein
MLAGDPTEAIHSELILETTRRYFDIAELKPMGGALAYLLLTFNAGIHSAPAAERDPVVEQVVAADAAYTDAHPDRTLFAFFWGRPRKSVLAETESLARWTATEDARETAAAANGGEYYPLTALQELTQEVQQLRMFNNHLRADAAPGAVPGPVSVRRVLVSELDRRWPRLTKALVKVKHRLQSLAK